VRKSVVLSSTPVVVGWRPVKSDVRLGLHSGYWQYARSNRTPAFARASRFGDFTTGCP